MILKAYKNAYGHKVVNCPFCSDFSYIREESKISPDELRDMKRHITFKAKDEALKKYIDPAISPGKHLVYLQSHAKEIDVIKNTKIQYDDDLKLE